MVQRRGRDHEATSLSQEVPMNVGVWIPNCRHLATPEIIRSTAVRAEHLGYDSIWVSDHVVVPHANVVNFGETVFDPLVTLAVVAGATSRVRLGTTVLIVPYRNPVVTAKKVSSLDALSGGRCILGISAGWVAAEHPINRSPEELRAGRAELTRLSKVRGRTEPPTVTLRNDVRVLRPGQSVPASTHGGRVLAGERAALVDQIVELADCGVGHLVLEFLAADGHELVEQMTTFAEQVRPRLP